VGQDSDPAIATGDRVRREPTSPGVARRVEASERFDDGGPPAELAPNWVDRVADATSAVSHVRTRSSLHALNGRREARLSFWDATFYSSHYGEE